MPPGCMVYSSPELGTVGLGSQPLQIPSWARDLCTIGVRRLLGPLTCGFGMAGAGQSWIPLGEVAETVSLIFSRGCLSSRAHHRVLVCHFTGPGWWPRAPHALQDMCLSASPPGFELR